MSKSNPRNNRKDDVIDFLKEHYSHDDKMWTLKAVPDIVPKRTKSANWKFSVKNLYGMTMGKITVHLSWKLSGDGCEVLAADYDYKDQESWFLTILPKVTRESNVFPCDNCEEDMDCITFRMDIDFVGMLNNIPYHEWHRICADGSETHS